MSIKWKFRLIMALLIVALIIHAVSTVWTEWSNRFQVNYLRVSLKEWNEAARANLAVSRQMKEITDLFAAESLELDEQIAQYNQARRRANQRFEQWVQAEQRKRRETGRARPQLMLRINKLRSRHDELSRHGDEIIQAIRNGNRRKMRDIYIDEIEPLYRSVFVRDFDELVSEELQGMYAEYRELLSNVGPRLWGNAFAHNQIEFARHYLSDVARLQAIQVTLMRNAIELRQMLFDVGFRPKKLTEYSISLRRNHRLLVSDHTDVRRVGLKNFEPMQNHNQEFAQATMNELRPFLDSFRDRMARVRELHANGEQEEANLLLENDIQPMVKEARSTLKSDLTMRQQEAVFAKISAGITRYALVYSLILSLCGFQIVKRLVRFHRKTPQPFSRNTGFDPTSGKIVSSA